MTRRILPIVLAIFASACNAPQPSSADVPAANSAAPPALEPLPLPDPAMDAAAPARPGELKTFRDWTVGCDNIGTCKAVALAPDGDTNAWPALFPAIERDAGRPGLIRLSFAGQAEATPPVTLAIDGRQIARGGNEQTMFEGSEARGIVDKLAQGAQLRIESAGTVSTISLAGLAAALRYIDDRQGRDGSAEALVAKGNGDDNSAAAPLPVLRALMPSGEATPLTPATIARLQKLAGCELYDGAPVFESTSHTLGGGATLALIACGSGAYNIITAPFLLSPGSDWRPAPLDAPSGFGEDSAGAPMLVNADFADGALTTYAKGRGLGDCGVTQSFVWDGNRFRLSQQAQMGECRGNTDYITTWRTRVIRR